VHHGINRRSAALGGPECGEIGAQEKRCSFLKKGTKKLLSLRCCTHVAHAVRLPDEKRKSFLLLFFKKEDLPSLPLPFPAPPLTTEKTGN
jgi:hypothetical protein